MEDCIISNMTLRVVPPGIREIIGDRGLGTVLNHSVVSETGGDQAIHGSKREQAACS